MATGTSFETTQNSKALHTEVGFFQFQAFFVELEMDYFLSLPSNNVEEYITSHLHVLLLDHLVHEAPDQIKCHFTTSGSIFGF